MQREAQRAVIWVTASHQVTIVDQLSNVQSHNHQGLLLLLLFSRHLHSGNPAGTSYSLRLFTIKIRKISSWSRPVDGRMRSILLSIIRLWETVMFSVTGLSRQLESFRVELCTTDYAADRHIIILLEIDSFRLSLIDQLLLLWIVVVVVIGSSCLDELDGDYCDKNNFINSISECYCDRMKEDEGICPSPLKSLAIMILIEWRDQQMMGSIRASCEHSLMYLVRWEQWISPHSEWKRSLCLEQFSLLHCPRTLSTSFNQPPTLID